MSYKIRVMQSGLFKADVIENGIAGKKKLMRGDIVDVVAIDEKELKLGYYKVFQPKLVVPSSVQRSREVEGNGQVTQLSQLINSLEVTLNAAKQVLSQCIAEPVFTPIPQEPKEEQNNLPILLDSQGNVPVEYRTNEDSKEEDIYDENDYRNGNQIYNRVMGNTLAHQMRSTDKNGRNIFKAGDLSLKKMPVVSEANLGKIKRPEIGLLDKDGNNGNRQTIAVIADKNGKIDVRKTLGLQLINQPQVETDD